MFGDVSPARAVSAICLVLVVVPLISWTMREHGIIVGKSAKIWRQRGLLVVGAPGSGTGQMAGGLRKLGLDVRHESSQGRDATVSWFHGMRLLKGTPDTSLLCQKPRHGIDWHPQSLEPQHCPGACMNGCWNECWKSQCPVVLRRQHGCHRRGGGPGSRHHCQPEFRTTLLQVRHPLATIASSVRGFCDGGMPNATASLLVQKIRAFIPQLGQRQRQRQRQQPERGGRGRRRQKRHRPSSQPPKGLHGGQPADGASVETEPCAEIFARFWLQYYTQAYTAADGWYRVEAASPCAVATAAGLDVHCDGGGGAPADGGAGDAVVMLRNRTADADAAAARGPSVDGGGGRRAAGGGAAAAAAVAASRAHGKHNRHNVDGFALTYADIEQLYGGPRLAKKLRALARRFGYDPR